MEGETETMLREAVEFEEMLESLEETLDRHILEVSGQKELDAKKQAYEIMKEYKARRKKVILLERSILQTKEETRVSRSTTAAVREKVKMAQAELSCMLLEVHALETERNALLQRTDPLLPERKERDALQEELLRLKKQNLEYPPVLAALNKETVSLENEISDIINSEKIFIAMLKERCVATGQELHQRLATEEEWGELRLVVSEQEAEIKRLRSRILAKGGTLPEFPTMERQRYEATLANIKADQHVKRYFAVPTGTLRHLATVQGHGLQGTRAKHNVQIDVDLGEAWAGNIISIAGPESAVDAAQGEVEKLCNSVLKPHEEALVTYPRPNNRAAPIATPWAKMQRQRAEIDASPS
eukprot:TRINITY_DN4531_c0_g1_i2.p2 TRINITY_DN4531_c0_g1~~TRINITY_DN4531_c0_g1_i2.p2  ORF type:complete len:357 (+),score=137.48 TRINITY_DN4531_c0_g1_i2:57-1127(+)